MFFLTLLLSQIAIRLLLFHPLLRLDLKFRYNWFDRKFSFEGFENQILERQKRKRFCKNVSFAKCEFSPQRYQHFSMRRASIRINLSKFNLRKYNLHNNCQSLKIPQTVIPLGNAGTGIPPAVLNLLCRSTKLSLNNLIKA